MLCDQSDTNKMPENVLNIYTREELLTKINELQQAIIKMNTEIFKDEINKRRPPSEYLETYNTLTEKIHNYQEQLKAVEPDPIPEYPHEPKQEYYLKSPNNIANQKQSLNSSKPNSPKKTIFDYCTYDQTSSQHLLQSPSTTNNYHSDSSDNPHSPSYKTSQNIKLKQTPRINIEKSEMPLRVFMLSYTVVIKKTENQTLMDALASKLRTRNIDARKYVAFNQITNEKIDWYTELARINANSVELAEDTVDLYHNFEKKTVLIRTCDMCRKSNILHASMCTKCKLTMCSKTNCRNRGEATLCRRNHHDTSSSKNNQSDSNLNDNNTYSRQILPFDQLKFIPNIQTRERSISDNELNMLVETPDSNSTNSNSSVLLEKSLSSNISNGKESNPFSTLPRNGFQKPVNKNTNKIKKPMRRDSLNHWEIPYTQIVDIGPKVGSGSFGTVHECKDFYHDKVAIKFLNIQNPSTQQYEAFRNEVAILKTARHGNILLFIGCISSPFLAIVTEWCKGSSLYKHLHVLEEHWNMYQLIDIAKQTSTGMEYLHATGIYHRDLKSNNIFLIPDENYMSSNVNENSVVEKWKVKIGDFGLAAVKSDWSKANSAKKSNPTGSILWLAPEVITQRVSDPYTQKSDVYSFGVVLYELCTGLLPYANKQQDTILFLVGIGRLKPNSDDVRSDTPTTVKNLLVQCCEYNRDKRPSFEDINKILKNLKISRLQRAQSAPNFSFLFHQMLTTGASITDEDNYPTTPRFDQNFGSHFTTNL